jgi:hypothetical protein
MNKNWNDRADKDLFFTILSVKNIGVISGSEWTTIGNHMRSLGYGFTNEGCRYVVRPVHLDLARRISPSSRASPSWRSFAACRRRARRRSPRVFDSVNKSSISMWGSSRVPGQTGDISSETGPWSMSGPRTTTHPACFVFPPWRPRHELTIMQATLSGPPPGSTQGRR